jgi:hypothetical protein
MSGIHDLTENAIMNLIFRSVVWAGYASVVGTETNIGIILHSADPGEGGNASTNEVTVASYTGYTRVNVLRTTGGWTAAVNGTINPSTNIDFPACTGGTGTSATYFSTSASNANPPTGAAVILWSGTIQPPITIGTTVTPRLTTATTISVT